MRDAFLLDRNGIPTNATVTGIERGVKCIGSRTIFNTACINLTYHFRTQAGQEITHSEHGVSPLRMRDVPYAPGDTITVYYDPAYPTNVGAKPTILSAIGGFVLIIMGAYLAFMSSLFWKRAHKGK